MSDLQRRLRDAAGSHARFPLETVRTRVRRRRQLRATATGVAAVALALSVGTAVLPRQPAIDLEVGAGPMARPVNIDVVDTPTSVPDGYDRCGQVTYDRDVTVQRFCDWAGQELVLRFGPHSQLPELGSQIDQTRGRPVYMEVLANRRYVTISDRQAPDDRHYRVEAPAAIPTSSLVEVIASVPAFAANTDTAPK